MIRKLSLNNRFLRLITSPSLTVFLISPVRFFTDSIVRSIRPILASVPVVLALLLLFWDFLNLDDLSMV